MEGKKGGKKNKKEEEIEGYSFEKLFKTLSELELLVPELDLNLKYNAMVKDLMGNGKSVKGYPPNVFALQEIGNKDILIELMAYIGIDVGFGTEKHNLNDMFYDILSGKKPSKEDSESDDDDLGYMDSDSDDEIKIPSGKERRVYDTDSDDDVDPDTASYSGYG